MTDAEKLYEVMNSRRSVRQFKPDRPPKDTVERLIEAAITAPSASNKQPWRFLAVANREVIARLAAAVREAVDRIAHHIEPAFEESFRAYGDYFTRFVEAPIVMVLLFRSMAVLSHLVGQRLPAEGRDRMVAMERDTGLTSASLAMQNLLLMAHAMGLGASAMTGPLAASDRIREILGIQPSWHVVAFIPLGYPDEDPAATPRKPVGQVLKWIE